MMSSSCDRAKKKKKAQCVDEIVSARPCHACSNLLLLTGLLLHMCRTRSGGHEMCGAVEAVVNKLTGKKQLNLNQ